MDDKLAELEQDTAFTIGDLNRSISFMTNRIAALESENTELKLALLELLAREEAREEAMMGADGDSDEADDAGEEREPVTLNMTSTNGEDEVRWRLPIPPG